MLWQIINHDYWKTGFGSLVADTISGLISFYTIVGMLLFFGLGAFLTVENYIEYKEFEQNVDTSKVYYIVSDPKDCEYIFDSDGKFLEVVYRGKASCSLTADELISYLNNHKEKSRGINATDTMDYIILVVVPFIFVCFGVLVFDRGFSSFILASILWMIIAVGSFFLVYRDYNCITTEGAYTYTNNSKQYDRTVYVERALLRKNSEGNYESLCFCATLMGNLSGNPPSVNDWR